MRAEGVSLYIILVFIAFRTGVNGNEQKNVDFIFR